MIVRKTVRMFGSLGCLGVAILLAGCWTVRETLPPTVEAQRLPAGKGLTVQVAGFDATVTTYETAYGYTTVSGYAGPCYDRWGRYRGCAYGTTTYATTEYIPRTEPTPVYRDRATDALERAGCILRAKDPRYRIEVRFDGPFIASGDLWSSAGWLLCTVLTADFGAQTWAAKLKIHDLSSGALLYEKDLSARDEALVWGPIPIFSPLCSTRVSPSVMKGNCLASLTDIAVAEAVSFLSRR